MGRTRGEWAATTSQSEGHISVANTAPNVSIGRICGSQPSILIR
jgi:hypothetical protein